MPPIIQPIPSDASPRDVLAAWPSEWPLAALVSASGARDTPRSRWSIIAIPTRVHAVKHADPADPLRDLPASAEDAPSVNSSLPFTGGWIGTISYELGHVIEPTAAHAGSHGFGYGDGSGHMDGKAPSGFPLMTWLRCDDVLIHDSVEGDWHQIGTHPLLRELCRGAAPARSQTDQARYSVAPFHRDASADDYQHAVARAVEYIHRGDVYQANIAHRMEAPFAGSPRAFFLDMLGAAAPWYGAYLETPGSVIASASPELFLRYDALSRRVETRPMKGTRGAEVDRAALTHSEKDRAELNMIVDLMRNDLGRVCEFGSIRVEEARVIEPHGGRAAGSTSPDPSTGVLQGVATVSGRVRTDCSLRDVLRATFPPGSVTGAPKVRAMQIIDELETFSRGPYCGAIGFISDSGDAQFSVAIRTATLEPHARDHSPLAVHGTDPRTCVPPRDFTGTLAYCVGAGIVADSNPEDEWEETLVKARPLLHTLRHDAM